MRLDQFMQKCGIVKQRSAAKKLCDGGAVKLNDKKAKASHTVKEEDSIKVKFARSLCIYEVLQIPKGNVRKEDRVNYAKLVAEEQFHQEI